jgi:glycerophosphoryl diester phosphodiesterase
MPLRIGHRGAAGHAPENTLQAIEAGIRLGADLVEIDVQRTRDGQLVVIHDKRVDRTTNGSGWVCEMTLAGLRALDAGEGGRIPTLAEVVELARGRVGLMVELGAPGIAEEVVKTVSAHRFPGPLVYASFLHAELLAVRQAAPEASTLALCEGVPVSATTFAAEAMATHVGLSKESVSAELVTALHRGGCQVFVYTVNEPEDIARVRALGVEGIISDFPDRLALRCPE